MTAAQQVTGRLGYAGLLPFVLPALLIAAGSQHSAIALTVVHAYAFGIISFLTGSWWGLALAPGSRNPLILSNLCFLVALAVFLFAPRWWPIVAAILLMGIFFVEQLTSLFPPFSHHYRKMRALLTLIASLSMLTVQLAK